MVGGGVGGAAGGGGGGAAAALCGGGARPPMGSRRGINQTTDVAVEDVSFVSPVIKEDFKLAKQLAGGGGRGST